MAIEKIEPKVDEFMVEDSSTKSTESKKTFPHMRMEHQFFPKTKKWEVGEEYIVTLKLKMTGLSISKFSNDSEFDIIGADIPSEKDDNNEEKD